MKQKTNEEGTYQYFVFEKKLVLDGPGTIEARVEKLTNDEMWLTMTQTGNLYKFRKPVY